MGGGGGVAGRGGGGGGGVFLLRPLFFFGNGSNSGSGSGVARLSSSSEEDISLPLLRLWLGAACFPFLVTFTSSPTEKEKLQYKEETRQVDREEWKVENKYNKFSCKYLAFEKLNNFHVWWSVKNSFNH